MSRIRDFLPIKESTQLFQARVNNRLYKVLVAKLAKTKISKRAFLEAAIKQYLNEESK